MAIMGMLSTLAVTGYFTAVRGMMKQRAASGLVNTLVLARQRACTDASKTSVVCFNMWAGIENNASTTTKRKAATPSYVICKALGKITYVSGDALGDEFTPLDRMFGVKSASASASFSSSYPIRIYNLTRGGWADVQQMVERRFYPGMGLKSPDDLGAPSFTGKLMPCFIAKNTSGWEIGDSYGVAVSPVAMLPKNIYFGDTLSPDSDSASSPATIVFEFYPDGRANSRSIELVMQENSDSGLTRIKNVSLSSNGDVSSGN